MLVTSKAPVRVDFAGGWTDVNIFARGAGGAVVNAAINHYVSGKLETVDPEDAAPSHPVEREGLSVSEPVSMAAGDASFHDGWVIHGAGPNLTDRPRAAMTVIYLEDGARVTEPDTGERRFDLAVWLPGLKPGDLVDSPVNPRL